MTQYGPDYDAGTDWTLEAKCLDKPTKWWMAEKGSRDDVDADSFRRAFFYCSTCPVKRECLEDDMFFETWKVNIRGVGEEPEWIYPMPEGIRAGTLAEERKKTRHLPKETRIPLLLAIAQNRYENMGMVSLEARQRQEEETA
jgi:hypothetical protein